MKRRQFLVGTWAILSGGGLLVGSNAFSATKIERDVTIDVVGDEDAYLTLIYGEGDQIDAESSQPEVMLVAIKNQVDHELTVESFEATSEEITIDAVDYPDSIGTGEREDVTITVDCDGAEDEPTVVFDITVSGRNMTAETTRSREVNLSLECRTEDS